MRRRTALLVAPVAVVAVGTSAFLGYGAWSRSQPVQYARGGAFVVDDGPAAAAPVVEEAEAAQPSPTPTAGAAPTARAAASQASSRGRPRTRAAVATPVPADSPVPVAAEATAARTEPVAGTYRLRVSGKERASFGPISPCSRSFPSASSWSVRKAEDGTWVVDQRFYPGSEGQHDERHVYRYGPGTVELEYEQATVTCAGQRQSSDVSFRPAQVRIRGPLRVGATWSSTGGDADRTEQANSRVLRAEDLVVQGRRIATWVVETKVDITGSEHGSRVQRWWWAPSLALPLRVDETITASRSGGEYTSTASAVVVGLPAGA